MEIPNETLPNDAIELRADEYLKDGIPYCKKCNTPRYFIRENFCHRCICKCQKEEMEKQEQAEEQKKIEEYLKQLRDKSLLGERYKDCSFDKIEIINEKHKETIERLKNYCSKFKESNKGIGIYLFGKSGAGKTLLTACMLDRLNAQYIECLFTSIQKIKEDLLSAGQKGQKGIMDKLTTVPVLFIDDFGTEVFKKDGEDNWTQDIVYNIINTRYNNMLPIIYTSNYSLRECLDDKGVLLKTVERIYESTVQMKLDLPSYRFHKKKDEIYF